VFSLIIIVAVVGSLAAIVMSAPRVYFAMARDGLFVPAAAVVHPRFGTPARAIALQALLASALVALGSFNQIVSYFVFVLVVFIALTVASLFVLRRNESSRPEYRTPGYPVTPMVFLVLVAGLLFLLGSNSPKQSFLGVGVVALGIPVYYFLFVRRVVGSTR
jgi:basic amino acid/polyamine antiporter, APA family